MKEHEMKAATRVSVGGIGEIAKQGLQRALAARSGAVVLTEEQTEQVGGGALSAALSRPIIAGPYPINVLGARLGGEVNVAQTLVG